MLFSVPIGLLLFLSVAHSCTEDCLVSDKKHPPPLVTEDKMATVHGKCYSTCISKLLHTYDVKELNCSTIQSIESCQEGCLLRNLFPKKMKGAKCITECASRCGDLEGIKWKRAYKSEACERQCKKESCETGCATKRLRRNHNKSIIQVNLPNPEVDPVAGRPGRFLVKETNIARKNETIDSRVAMVIRIQDQSSNTTYFEWQPGLKATIDLQYFACKEVLISVKIVFGHKTTKYTSHVATCVNGVKTDSDKNLGEKYYRKYSMQVTSRLEALHKQTNKIMKYVDLNFNDENNVAHNQLKEMVIELKNHITA